MKHILHYKIFEELTEKELNHILDKIEKTGIESLTSDERKKLDSFDGSFDKEKSGDVSFDKDGNLLINGNPPYKNVQSDKNTSPKIEPKKNIEPPKITNLYTLLQNKFNDNQLIIIFNDTNFSVSLDKKIQSVRTYYINFKKVKEKKSRASCLKMDYNLNYRTKGFNDTGNFKIYDNYSNEIPFKNLPEFLSQHGLSYGDFNTAFYYTEEDFNTKSY